MFKPNIGLIMIAAVAFGGGMVVRELFAGNGEAPVEEQTNSRTRPAQARPLPGPAGGNDAGRPRASSGDGIAALAKPVLHIGPQAERLRRFLPILDGLDAGNWEQLLRIMTDETSQNGRFQQQEWDLTLRRVGMVDGARAAAVFAAKGEEESLRKVLAGWAQTDPDAAWKFLETYKDEGGRRDVWRGVLIGLAELDPNQAMGKLDSLPFEVKGGTISFLIAPMVQAEGIDATAARIKEIYADYKAKDPATISAKEREYVYAFFHNVCDIKRNAGYTPEKRMEALELLAGFPDLAMRSPWLIPRTVASAARDNPERTMEIVETMTVVNGELLDTEGVDEAAKIWKEKDPAGFGEWIEKNRGKPLADRAAAFVMGSGG